MPHGRFSGSLTSPKIDVVVDMGNPFLNRTVDGFLKIGAVRSPHFSAPLLPSLPCFPARAHQQFAMYLTHPSILNF
jgi:hypothetical protein